VRYVEDMKKATLAEFDKEEAEWRETAERQVLHLCEIEDPLPTPEELDELHPDEAISRIETVVENNTQLCFAVDGDTRSWGEMAVARVKARAKAKTRSVT
jgi:hypothetical protein